MIQTLQLLTELDIKLNKLSTSTYQGIPLEVKLLALNNAQIQLVKQKIDINNIYGIGFDGFKKRYEDLQILIVESEKTTPIKTKNIYTSYDIDLTTLNNKYMFPVLIAGACTKGKCSNRIVAATKISKHSDLQMYLNNNHYCPSFEYQETIATVSKNKLQFFTDDTFKVDNIYLTYIKYPQEVDVSGYEHLDGTPSIDQDSEFDYYLKDEILDLATLELALSTDNKPAVEASQIRLKNNE